MMHIAVETKAVANHRAECVSAPVLRRLPGFNAAVLCAALQQERRTRRRTRPFTDRPADAARVTKIPVCFTEYVYSVTSVFVFKTSTLVHIPPRAQHQLWHHIITLPARRF